MKGYISYADLLEHYQRNRPQHRIEFNDDNIDEWLDRMEAQYGDMRARHDKRPLDYTGGTRIA